MSNRRLFSLIVALSFLAVIILSCINLFSLTPAYKHLIIKDTELEAVRIARHLQEMLVAKKELSLALFSTDEQVRGAVQDFGLMKLKLFTAKGETIFSTDGKDIGTAISSSPCFPARGWWAFCTSICLPAPRWTKATGIC